MRLQTYQKKPVAKITRATTPITMPAIAPIEREACECWSSSSTDSDTTGFPADEVAEPRVPKDCEAAVAAMLGPYACFARTKKHHAVYYPPGARHTLISNKNVTTVSASLPVIKYAVLHRLTRAD